jgi:tRNA nucleotidyltransferase (CCA-adding enzyme)
MNVILTHEQADFDAAGALLGAWLLDESSKAVLPSRINRNLHRFLNLYSSELPFVDFRDLPAEPVQKVMLVDTQSLVTLKGFSAKTKVEVIDHHPQRENNDPTWQMNLDKTGACTTVFVERLHDHLSSLSVIQNTLLLLGIYEDTGSMNYASTLARDIRAAAALVEAGASLRIAAEFLNPALSDEQKQLADRLMASAKTLDIHGKVILIASADGREMNDEVSSVAHKLRDLFDPDGLFMIIKTRDGIRVVARSTSDQVNAAAVAALFGGGGHERAASALIDPHDEQYPKGSSPLTEIETKLTNALPAIIQPSITIGKIMSKHPLLLSPETSLEEAERAFQRYGYEGFPVISDGKVVGLLTRRAVDRALSHHLKVKTSSIMEAGNYSLSTRDTVDQLQALMASTGWGQIPVIDPENHDVVGIATRTDLLRTLSQDVAFVPGKLNYASLLEKLLPGQRFALLKLVADEAATEKLPIYIVGGFVRDLLLDHFSADFDIVVEGEAIQLANRLFEHFGGRVISHNRFGTAKWMIKDIKKKLLHEFGYLDTEAEMLPDSLDLISARTEFYDHPTALPTVERSSIKLDLHRRDFTINTMALRLDGRHFGELYDYWDGLADLQKKQVKVLHSLSFVDDPTRLLRAVRFEQRFHFKIEARTLQLMQEARPLFKQISGDRLRHEFNLVFEEDHPVPILARLQELGLIQAVHPSLAWKSEYAAVLEAVLHADIPNTWHMPGQIGHTPIKTALAYLVWLLQLKCKECLDIAERFHLNNQIVDALKRAMRLWNEFYSLAELRPGELAERMQDLPPIAGYALFLLCTPGKLKTALEEYFMRWYKFSPVTDGNRLKALGLEPGPRYSEIIRRLRAAWIDGEITSPEQEETLLKEILEPTGK